MIAPEHQILIDQILKSREEGSQGVAERVSQDTFDHINASMKKLRSTPVDRPSTLYDTVMQYLSGEKFKQFQKKTGKIKEASFYVYADIDKSTWSEMKNAKVQVRKKTLLKLIIALELNQEQAEALLQIGQACFDPTDFQDEIVQAIIDVRQSYNTTITVMDAMEILDYYSQHGKRRFVSIYEKGSSPKLLLKTGCFSKECMVIYDHRKARGLGNNKTEDITMKRFTDEQFLKLKESAEKTIAEMQENKNIRDILAGIYTSNLDDKTEEQGRLIAGAILKSIREFDADYAEAQKDVDKYIGRIMKQIDQEKSRKDRCERWLKLSAGIAAAAKVVHGEDVNRDDLIEQLKSLSVSDAEATPELEKQLRKQAYNAIRDSGVLLCSLSDNVEALSTGSAEQSAELLIGIAGRDVEYRAILAMQAYTGIISGMYDDMPVNMNAAQVTTLICAQAEEARILDAVGKGSISKTIAASLLSVLGVVVLVKVFIVVLSVGVSAALTLFSGILAIPAMLMVTVGLFKLYESALNKWSTLANKTVDCTFAAVEHIAKGATIVGTYIKDNIIPKICEVAKTIWAVITTPFNVSAPEQERTQTKLVSENA